MTIQNISSGGQERRNLLSVAQWREVSGPQVVRQALIDWLGSDPEYQIGCAWLTADLRLIQADTFFIESDGIENLMLDSIIAAAKKHAAACVVLAINKTRGSNNQIPSHLEVRQQVESAFKQIKVVVLDYFLVSDTHAISFHERGQM